MSYISQGALEMHPAVQHRKRRAFAALAVGVPVLVAAVLAAGLSPRPSQTFRVLPVGGTEAGSPKLILWAWERAEHLDFIDPREVEVAFLASTLHLRNVGAVIRPRLQPLRVPSGTLLTAVVRIEPDRTGPPNLSLHQLEAAVAAIIPMTALPRVYALQIDFEARASERPFLRNLLTELRRRLPAFMPLSMTALASWCLHDAWLADLPATEAVPMLFRMGPEGRDVLHRLQAGRDFRPALCRRSLGVSTDETIPALPRGRRVFAFRARPWSQVAVQALRREVTQR